MGHILYDIRSYVEEFPKPDKSVKIIGKIKYSVGGSATNVVCNISKMGAKTNLIGKIGFDDNGRYILNSLKELNVNTDSIIISKEGSSGISIIIINKMGEPVIVEMLGVNEPLLESDIDYKPIDRSKHIHFSGTTTKTLERISEYVKKQGKSLSFDPGRAISSFGFNRLKNIFKNSDILFINRKECSSILGLDVVHFEKAFDLLTKKLPDKTIVIKGGKMDTMVYDKGKKFSASTIPVKIVDTIGAGDAFCAGWIYSFIKGNDSEESARFANACGALKVIKEGASGLPFKKDIMKFYEKNKDRIRIKELK